LSHAWLPCLLGIQLRIRAWSTRPAEHRLNETRRQSNKALRITRKRRSRPIGSRLKMNKLDGILLMPHAATDL
jgi:hypothetical protein